MRKTEPNRYAVAADTLDEFIVALEATGLLSKLAAHDPKRLATHAMPQLQFCAGIYPEQDFDLSGGVYQQRDIKPIPLARDQGCLISCDIRFEDIQRLVDK